MLEIRRVEAEATEQAWSGLREIGWEGVIDGAPFVVERGIAGDHRFVHGSPPDRRGAPTVDTRAIHHLCASASVLRCTPTEPADPRWWRVVLDSVLFTVALLRGYEALHAGALATPGGVIAITAATGGGKSTLVTELIGRRLSLMADDVLVLEPRGSEAPLAYPAPPLMTVPAAKVAMLSNVACAPETICPIGGERWVAVPVHQDPLPLKALIVLNRRAESKVSLARIERPLAPLLDSLMGFPRTPERQQTRFELASAIAATTGLWRLTGALDTPPSMLADTLLAAEL
ncbi:MAG TPA: hypothetical protein VIH71_13800 [Solirubrobacteraceae bacterium]